VKAQLQILYRLQQLEQQKVAVSNQKAKVNSDEVRHLWQQIRLLAQNVAANKQTLSNLETVCAKQETELAAVTRQCQQVEVKLYGGGITNLKELEQTTDNCDKMRKDIARRENEAFTSIESCEQVTAQIATDEALLQQKKRQHAEKQQQITQALAGFESQLAEIEAEQRKLADQVEADLLRRFRELARKKNAPIAKVENGACGGCRMSIPMHQAALTRSMVVHCDNCGRILFAEEERKP
jgi:uncharacterized protein